MTSDLNIPTLATCFQLALRFEAGVITPQEIITWADRLIAEEDEPEYWLIELSTTPIKDLESRLSSLSSGADQIEALNQFLGYIQRGWHNSQITIGALRSIGWRLHCNGSLDPTNEMSDWGFSLECIGEELDEGWVEESKFREFTSESLQCYRPFTKFTEVINNLRNKSANKPQ